MNSLNINYYGDYPELDDIIYNLIGFYANNKGFDPDTNTRRLSFDFHDKKTLIKAKKRLASKSKKLIKQFKLVDKIRIKIMTG